MKKLLEQLLNEQITNITLDSFGDLNFTIGEYRYTYHHATPGMFKKFKKLSFNIHNALEYIHQFVKPEDRIKIVDNKFTATRSK